MRAHTALPSTTPTRGEYTVGAPRHTDAIAEPLRSAFGVQPLPAEWVRTLETLDRT